MDVRDLMTVDLAANLGSGSLWALSPAPFELLGLPRSARPAISAALLASGAVHAATLATSHSRGLTIGSAAAINAGWVMAGLSARDLPLRPWQRGVLGVIAAYDVAMAAGKFSAGRRRGQTVSGPSEN